MFANWNLLIPADKDKSAPRNPAIKKARLTSITYPRCLSLCATPTTPATVSSLDTITQIFSTIRKPSDIRPSHLQLLNVSYTYDLPLSSLIPVKYHPDENDSDENSLFNQRKKEIIVENQDAYDFIARRRRDIKIGNFYKFFQALEMVELILSSESSGELKDKDGKDSRMDGIPVDGGAAGAAARSAAKYREELLRNFVDPVAWGFDMRIFPPRYPPKLLSHHSLFSVKADLYLHLQPPTPMERREGIVIGPAAVLQTRNEERFTETDDVADAVHELSALLTLSQERCRTGMHKKVRYRAVGKDKEVGGDDLFVISSVNHHLAISHVFLTDAYIRFIRTGQIPPEDYRTRNPQWCSCRIGRTKWYSLIEVDGRIDALKAIMAMMSWLKRTE